MVSLVLFSIYPITDNHRERSSLADIENFLSLQYPDYLTLKHSINETSGIKKPVTGINGISNDWYSDALNKIRQEEYNITYSKEAEAFQSTNRANHIRFVFHNNGFIAQSRENRIPLFDINDMLIREEEKEYRHVKDWSVKLILEGIKNKKFKSESEGLHVSENKAWTENNDFRIDYTNSTEGMRQNFIIKKKLSGEDDLQLLMNVYTELTMSVNKDGVIFKSQNDGTEKMQYVSLKAWDATGKMLAAYFEERSSKQFAIRVIDKNAQYPVLVDPLSTAPDWIVTCDQQYSRYGDGLSAGDINGDGFDDVAVGAPASEPGGAVFVYFGSAIGPSIIPDQVFHGEDIGFGNRLDCKGDVNNDGYNDLIVGDPFWGGGRVFIYHGSPTGLPDSANMQVRSLFSGGSNFGYIVSSADVNGDGYSDLITNMTDEVYPPSLNVIAYVFSGSAAGITWYPDWIATVPINEYDVFNPYVSNAGDINGDGYEDVIAGLSQSNTVLIYYGSPDRQFTDSAECKITNPVYEFGHSVSGAGDVNSDGFKDVVIGSRGGAAFAFYGSQNGPSLTFDWMKSGQNNCYGYLINTAGDFNQDGFDDIVVSDCIDSVHLFFGSSSGLTDNPVELKAPCYNLSSGDINGDGISDVLSSREPRVYGFYGSVNFTPPAIAILSPSQNAINVNKTSDITVVFDQDMKASTINSSNIKVYASHSGFMNCVISYDATQRKIIINPDNDFKTGEEISVTLKSGIQNLSGTEMNPFVYQFTAASTSGTGLFTETSVIDSIGTHPICIAAGDVDSDGNVDLIIGKGNSIKIYKNNGAAHFTEFSLINENGYFRTGDVDNDGDLDILLGGNDFLKIFINDGTGMFTFSNSSVGSAGEIADLDGDGDLDIAFNGKHSAFSSYKNIVIEKNTNGIFSVDSIYNINPCYDYSGFVSYISITDFNNDGRLDVSEYEYGLTCDVLEHCYGCGYLLVLKNSLQNNFVNHTIFTSSFIWESYDIFYKCLLLSFNKDNDNDADFISPYFNLTNQSNEVFTDDDPRPEIIHNAVKGDYDGDGDIDISSNMNVYKNDGQGNFSEYVINNIHIDLPEPVSADFDNNGSLDFAAVKYNSNGVSILLNNYDCPHPVFSISGNTLILVGSSNNIFVSSTGNGYWDISNYDSAQASIPQNSNGDTVLVSAGNNVGQFVLYFRAFYDCGGDTLLSMHIYIDNPLTVEMTTFNSLISGRNVTLNWTTNSEINNSGFDIERQEVRRETQDEWIRTGFVSGNGTTTLPQNYSFTERNLSTGNYKYRLKQIDYNGSIDYFELAEEVIVGIPVKYDLSQNYPNPFNPVTTINYDLPKDGIVTIKVYDILGREMKTLINEMKTAGYHKIIFNAADFTSGIYFYRMTVGPNREAGEFIAVKKFVIMK